MSGPFENDFVFRGDRDEACRTESPPPDERERASHPPPPSITSSIVMEEIDELRQEILHINTNFDRMRIEVKNIIQGALQQALKPAETTKKPPVEEKASTFDPFKPPHDPKSNDSARKMTDPILTKKISGYPTLFSYPPWWYSSS